MNTDIVFNTKNKDFLIEIKRIFQAKLMNITQQIIFM